MKNKNNQKWLGPLGEILTLVGALCFAGFEGWPAVSGLIVALAAVAAAFYRHESEKYLVSSVRKALSLVPGVLVHLNLIDTEKAISLTALIPPAAAIYWSWRDNGGGKPKMNDGRFPSFVILLSLCFLVWSCAGYTPPTVTPDGCLMQPITKEGYGKYYVGYCTDGRMIVQWTGEDLGDGSAVQVRLVRFRSGALVTQYQTGDTWLEWSSKSGISIGTIPPYDSAPHTPVTINAAK